MPIEQVKPNKPNFLLIVILSCLTLLGGLALALTFLKFDGKHLTFRHGSPQPNSLLAPPTRSSSLLV